MQQEKRPANSSHPANDKGRSANAPVRERRNTPSAADRQGRRPAEQQKQRRPANTQPRNNTVPRAKRSNEWIYPEGYTPPKSQNRRPADNRRKAPAKKQQKPVVIVDWKRVGSIILAILIRFLICLAAVVLVMGIAYRNIFYSTMKPPVKNVTYKFITVEGEGDEAETLTNEMDFPYTKAYSGDQMLISFSEVSKWLGTAQVGDVYQMRFILGEGTDSDEDVVFHNSSHNAIVNGSIITMKAPAQFRNGEVWIPVSFLTDYLVGVEIIQTPEAATLSLSGEPVSFILRPSQPLTPAEPPED